MGRLTTHVLDTAHGCPAAGVAVRLYRVADDLSLLAESVTNDDGRLDSALLQDGDFEPGVYQLNFSAGDYFRHRQAEMPEPPFVDEVVLRFGIADGDQHYHVPLLVSPWSYSTYRGS